MIFESYETRWNATKQRLHQLMVVATTRRNCKDGHAAIGIAADDVGIGNEVANIIHERSSGHISHFGTRPIDVPALKYWINESVSNRQKLRYSEEILRAAEGVFVGDECVRGEEFIQKYPLSEIISR